MHANLSLPIGRSQAREGGRQGYASRPITHLSRDRAGDGMVRQITAIRGPPWTSLIKMISDYTRYEGLRFATHRKLSNQH